MKEVFTKSFWEGVKNTFDEAREGRPLDNTSKTPAEGAVGASTTPEALPATTVSSEQS